MRKILSILIVSSCLFGFMRIPIYSDYMARGYADNAELYITHIADAATIYYTREGMLPNSIDDMVGIGYLHFGFDESAMREWRFSFDLDYDEEEQMIVGYIYAVSTREMPGGHGHMVGFDIVRGQFSGYGQKLECDYCH